MPTLDKHAADKFSLDNFLIDKFKLDSFVLDGVSGNLLLGATAYSLNDIGFLPSAAIDGDISTFTTSSGGASSNWWWACKLAAISTFSTVKIIGRSGYPQLNFKNFKIQGSSDSTNGSDGTWTDLATGLNTSASVQWDTFTISSSTYRWVRLYGAKQFLSGSDYYIQFAEFQLL